MQRIHNILERCILEYFSNLESNPHETIAFTAIADALYGEKEEDVSLNICFDIYFFKQNTKYYLYLYQFSWKRD